MRTTYRYFQVNATRAISYNANRNICDTPGSILSCQRRFSGFTFIQQKVVGLRFTHSAPPSIHSLPQIDYMPLPFSTLIIFYFNSTSNHKTAATAVAAFRHGVTCFSNLVKQVTTLCACFCPTEDMRKPCRRHQVASLGVIFKWHIYI